MQVTIIKKNKLSNFNLPENINGSHWITDYDNGKKLNLLNVEAENNKWKLISNSDTYVVDNKGLMVPYVELKDYAIYLIKNNIKNENYYLYCSPVYDKTFKELSITDSNRINVGSNAECDICYTLGGISDKSFNIEKTTNNNFILSLIDKNASVYVNKKRVGNIKRIQYGDIIFMFGLKIIIMKKDGKDYLLVNNPNNLLKFNANFVNINLVKDEFIEDNQELSEDAITGDINYFYRTPYFYGVLNKYILKIDAPPQKKDEDDRPALLTIGPMITMSMTSVVMLMSTLSSVSSGEKDTRSATTSIVMCVAMLASALLWPTLTRMYQKFADKRYEKKRQKKYREYIDKKEKEIENELQNQRNTLINNNLSIAECQNVILNQDVKLWQRRIADEDFLSIPLGIGNLPMQIEINYPEEHFTLSEDNLLDLVHNLGKKERILNDVPITFSFYNNIVTGLVGNPIIGKAFFDRIILQMMTNYSYNEVKFVTFTSEENENDWEFMKTLPHSWTNDKSFRFFGSSSDEYREIVYILEKIYNSRVNSNIEKGYDTHYVIVTDAIKSIDNYDLIKKIMQNKQNYGFSIILLVDKLSALPNECKNFIKIDKDYCTIFDSIVNSNNNQQFKIDFTEINDIYECSKVLSNIPLLIKSNLEMDLPDVFHFLEMYQIGKIDQFNSLERWKRSNPMLSLQAPVGIGKSGEVITLDLHEKYHGPHGLIAGTTGSGKSEFIITYILSLAVNYHPYEVQIILIDYKGGSLAGAFQNDKYRLPHLAGTITNLDGNELNRSLASIDSEIKRRQRQFNEARKITGESTMDIYKYQKLWREGRLKDMEPIAHLFIISDEFAELKEQQPEFMDNLISTARVGRSLGVHLILATQKPGGVVNAQIWSNTRFRVCLKVQDTGDSQEVIKKPDAAYLKKTGRFYLQVGTDEIFTLGQSAWAGGQYYPNTTFKKETDVSVNLINNIGFVTSTKELEVKDNIESLGEQLPNVVKYLFDIAKSANIKIKKLWLDKIPEKIYIDNLKEKYNFTKQEFYLNPIIGEYDDPASQNQYALNVPLSKLGNALIYGITGSGKEEFLYSLLYSCMSSYTPNELNFYIMDFGSETMQLFNESVYCGGVALINDKEKIINLFKLINEELVKRKKILYKFGGNYQRYIASGYKDLPNILIVLNNYELFAENYDELVDEIGQITRDAYKYGIYFIITASATNSVRSKIKNNFSLLYALQQNNESDYYDIVGNCRGKLPSNNKGRGLFRRDSIYEFQTAMVSQDDEINYLINYIKESNEKYDYRAKKIPVMPDVVDYDFVKDSINSYREIIVGINKNNLLVEKYDILKSVINVVTSNYIENLKNITNCIISQISYYSNNYQLVAINSTEINIDKEMHTSNFNLIIKNINDYVEKVYAKYVESNYNSSLIKSYKKIAVVIYGLSGFINKLDAEGKENFNNIIKKCNHLEIVTFIVIEETDLIKQYSYEEWFRSGFDSSTGIWVGSGISEQSLIKLNKIDRDTREDINNNFGYIVRKGRSERIKLLTDFNLSNKNDN